MTDRKTLEKFIEYLKEIYIEDYNDKAEISKVNLETAQTEGYWYHKGQCDAIQRLIDLLDKDLENFMEGQNNGK